MVRSRSTSVAVGMGKKTMFVELGPAGHSMAEGKAGGACPQRTGRSKKVLSRGDRAAWVEPKVTTRL